MENRDDKDRYFRDRDFSTLSCSDGFTCWDYQTDTLVLPQFPCSAGDTKVPSCYSVWKMSTRLATTLCGISLKTPVLAASGTYGYGVEFKKLTDLAKVGGIIVKGLSREPMEGNAPPRLYETEGGMMNSIGLQNIGVRAFVADKLPELRQCGTAIFANVFGYSVEELPGSGPRGCWRTPRGVAAYELKRIPAREYQATAVIFFSERSQCCSWRKWWARCGRTGRPSAADRETIAERGSDRTRRAGGGGGCVARDAISLVNTFVALAIDARRQVPGAP